MYAPAMSYQMTQVLSDPEIASLPIEGQLEHVHFRAGEPLSVYTGLIGTILMIIAAAVLFGYMLTSLYLTQTLAQAIAEANVNRWVLMGMINLFLLVCGFFIPPAAIILMTSPILFPIITAAGFDPVWFGVIMTINMEIGLIHPPVGLNIYIVNSIAPDVPVTRVMWGTIPYVICMFLAIVILCIFPEIATWLPNHMMGAKH